MAKRIKAKKLKEETKKVKTEKPSETNAIIGLIVNLFLPGLGTIIFGKYNIGVLQLVLFLVGIPLIVVFGLGILLMAAMWIWALVTGINAIKEARK